MENKAILSILLLTIFVSGYAALSDDGNSIVIEQEVIGLNGTEKIITTITPIDEKNATTSIMRYDINGTLISERHGSTSNYTYLITGVK